LIFIPNGQNFNKEKKEKAYGKKNKYELLMSVFFSGIEFFAMGKHVNE